MLGAGCQSPRANTPSQALGLQESASQISTAYSELDDTLQSLNNLVYTPGQDLRPQYQVFAANLDELQDVASDVRSASLQMQVRGNNYFQGWTTEISEMHSAQVREASADRRDQVLEQFSQTAGFYRDANEELTEFLTLLEDVNAHLATDLTPGGIDAIRDQVEEINERSTEVRDALSEVSTHFQDLGAVMPQRDYAASEEQ